jgi:hypothetical protein
VLTKRVVEVEDEGIVGVNEDLKKMKVFVMDLV